jgi:hypothetical protein
VKKRITPMTPAPVPDAEWLNLEGVEVELTSEDPDQPIEGALLPGRSPGWRAAAAGPQRIRLAWPTPVRLRRIRLVFEELSQPRTQEFVLRAYTLLGERDIVRQQFTFSPPGTVVEYEEYAASLEGVTRLELTIIPAIDGREAVAALKEWRAA